jgi:hypothetical protein
VAARRGLGSAPIAIAAEAMSPALSPERQRLADAIARRDKLLADEAMLAKARPNATQQLYAADRELAAARQALEEAGEVAGTDSIVALAEGAVTDAPVDLEAARVRLRRAEDAARSAQATREEIDRRARAVQDRLPGVRPDVEAAAWAVIFAETRPERDALTQRVYAAQVEFCDATRSLHLMRGQPRPLREEDKAHDAAACAPVQLPENASLPTVAKLRAWQTALLTDATAQAPA